MKGVQTLFSQLLTTASEDATRRTPGRNRELIARRDERLVHRHYYYLRISKKRYDEIIQLLSEEFDLSGSTIIERLQLENNFQLLKQLTTQQPSLNDLRKRYPWMVWK
ncbi:MAG: hypothetical protein JO154_20505 [Chitinophaga sp.]|uniref:hypothetical protein n=1 Tax=Chitinophaga sp. TaxID=1869181 RepID=UPI0025C2FB07|nr:hypothetical protein [Chitinophaga sp.]MBV8254994.1 hypothetical protein [Chitinophaga sp.]